MMRKVVFQDLGFKKYKPTWDYQEELFDEIVRTKSANRKLPEEERRETQDYLLFVHHPHVYTLGKSGKAEHLLISEDRMKEEGIDWFKINRGGDITYHGPGQLVGYPIFDLDEHFTDIHKYLRYLEEAIIRTIAEYGLEGERSPGETGVWLDVGKPNARKICALGVRASRWVTMHGFAFNVESDLSYFENIVPCGIADKAVASLHLEIGYSPDMEKIKEQVKQHLSDLFEIEFTDQ